MRHLTVSKPTLITWKGTPNQIKRNIFSYNEEMGFTKEEIKKMVLKCPEVLKNSSELNLLNQFEVLHNEGKISHEILSNFPESLTRTALNTRPRLQFLKAIGRDQFDPNVPNYISPGRTIIKLVSSLNINFFQQC